jgi:hypothetical protein
VADEFRSDAEAIRAMELPTCAFDGVADAEASVGQTLVVTTMEATPPSGDAVPLSGFGPWHASVITTDVVAPARMSNVVEPAQLNEPSVDVPVTEIWYPVATGSGTENVAVVVCCETSTAPAATVFPPRVTE